MNEYINKQLCSKSAQYKTNTSKQLLASCSHIHQVSGLVFRCQGIQVKKQKLHF